MDKKNKNIQKARAITDDLITEFINTEYKGLSKEIWNEEMLRDFELIKRAFIFLENRIKE